MSPSSSSSLAPKMAIATLTNDFLARNLAWVGILLVPSAAFSATNQAINADLEGRTLVTEILAQKPSANSTNTGVITVRDKDNKRTQAVIRVDVIVTESGWKSTYLFKGKATYGHTLTEPSRVPPEYLEIVHVDAQPNRYIKHFLGSHLIIGYSIATNTSQAFEGQILTEKDIFEPFGKSDFWLCDLGLEFFHWPAQKVLKHEMRRGQFCKVLESKNPSPGTNGYSRVVSWIDMDTLGIVMAEAYDPKGKLLKEFKPKDLKKVNGQWQLHTMEIENAQTESSTRIEFDLDKK